MEEIRCKCGIVSYKLDDGTMKWCCDPCDPDSPNKKKKFRTVIVGDYCDNDTLLHLLETGEVHATVPAHAEDTFCDMYSYIKDKEPVWDVYCARHPGDKDGKRWYDMSIIFDKTDSDLNFNDQLRIEEHSDHRKILYSNEFIRYLLRCGFDFGKSHDHEKVMRVVLD